jgi:antibiotic biosynthesis monooxygenase (ABM) superfamily enzyme
MATQDGTGLLVAWMDIPAAQEAEFNDWYNTEHDPERTSVPGFLSGRRYTSVEGEPKYLCLYECADEHVLTSDAYMKQKNNSTAWTRRMLRYFKDTREVYRRILSSGKPLTEPAKFVYTVRVDVAPEHESEFKEWFKTDHLPALAAVPGVLRARCYEAVDSKFKYMAIFELEDPQVLKSPAWEKARDSDWTQRMRAKFRDRKAVVSRSMGA